MEPPRLEANPSLEKIMSDWVWSLFLEASVHMLTNVGSAPDRSSGKPFNWQKVGKFLWPRQCRIENLTEDGASNRGGVDAKGDQTAANRRR